MYTQNSNRKVRANTMFISSKDLNQVSIGPQEKYEKNKEGDK